MLFWLTSVNVRVNFCNSIQMNTALQLVPVVDDGETEIDATVVAVLALVLDITVSASEIE